MVWNALKLFVGALSRLFGASLLGAIVGAVIGALQGAFFGALYGFVSSALDNFSRIELIPVGALSGGMSGGACGFALGAISFGFLEVCYVFSRRSPLQRLHADTFYDGAASLAARLAFVCAVCGFLLSFVLQGVIPRSTTNIGPVGLLAISWCIGFFFGALLGGLLHDAPQTGIAPLDWLLRWLWR